MVVCQSLIPCCLSVSILTSTNETLTLDICLGNYEQYFVKSSEVQVCVVGKSWQRILCTLSVIIYSIFSSNVWDAILLYIIFTKVKHRTEKSKAMIGEKAYGVRKRYVLWVQLLIPETLLGLVLIKINTVLANFNNTRPSLILNN